MKILLVDCDLSGHHYNYLKALTQKIDCILILPRKVDFKDTNEQYTFDFYKYKKNSFNYIRLLLYIKKIAKKENVDIIHFLTMDFYSRYFGFGLKWLNKYFLIATFHHFYYSRLKNMSRKRIFNIIDYGIVHTNNLSDFMNSCGVFNCKTIMYPVFNFNVQMFNNARSFWGIPENDIPVIVAVGGTRYDKGLDILLDALNIVNQRFYLLIAGNPEYFQNDFINSKIKKYRDKVYLKLKYLTEQEFKMAIAVADFIVLPYRLEFDGASGPLAEGVYMYKGIIGPNHGSLGRIINDNNIGYTFKSESVNDLAYIINKALQERFFYDVKACSYRDELEPSHFINEHLKLYSSCIKCKEV